MGEIAGHLVLIQRAALAQYQLPYSSCWLFRQYSQGSDIAFTFSLGRSFGLRLRGQLLEHLRLHPGHGVVAGLLAGDEALILMPISVNIPSCSVRMFHSGSFSWRS